MRHFLNKSTRCGLCTFILASVAFWSASAKASTVAQMEAEATGTITTVGDTSPLIITGILSVPGTTDGFTHIGSYIFLADDGTGSTQFYGAMPTGSPYVPTVGDAITATGTYTRYQAAPEIDSLTSISPVSSGNPNPDPKFITAASLQAPPTDSVLGYLLTLQNVEFTTPGLEIPADTSTSYTVTDLSGQNPVDIYQTFSYSSSGLLAGTILPAGPVDITGVVQVYTPASGSPFTEFIPIGITSVPEPTSLSVVVMAAAAFLKRRGKRSAV